MLALEVNIMLDSRDILVYFFTTTYVGDLDEI